jgi:hypothetical protein
MTGSCFVLLLIRTHRGPLKKGHIMVVEDHHRGPVMAPHTEGLKILQLKYKKCLLVLHTYQNTISGQTYLHFVLPAPT